jgi:membrane-bound serine protease (ClpP class)
VILIDSDVPGFGVPIPLIVTIATTGSVALLGIIWFALRARRLPVVSGAEELMRSTATALEDFEREGAVLAHGERWHARSISPVDAGQSLRITKVEGLVLEVEPKPER